MKVKIGIALACLGSLLTAACADEVVIAPPPPTAAQTPGVAPVQMRTMPLPKGQWTKATNIEHYKVFATHKDAITWFDAFKAKYLSSKALNAMPLTDPRYAVLETELATIWKAFSDLFPRDTEGLTKPPFIILTDSTEVNAFAVYDPDLQVAPHAFVVNVGVFTSKNGKANDAQLRGLIAHELGHHVLKHVWPGVGDKVQKWYSIDTAIGDGFGWQQKDDARIRAKGQQIIVGAIDAGDWPMLEWNGVPRLGGTLDTTLQLIHTKAQAKAPDLCTTAGAAYVEIGKYLETVTDPLDNLSTTAAVRKRISELTQSFVDKEIACATASETDDTTLWAILAEQLQVSESTLRSKMPKDMTTVIDGAPSSIEAVFTLVRRIDQAGVALGDMSKVRYYSAEEEADDVSVNVLFRAGLDANGNASLIQDIHYDDNTAKACEASANAGEPTYGGLSDAHHHSCWRIWHSRELVKYLSTPE